MNQIYAVVVIYNQNISESLTCSQLMEIRNHNIRIIIVDNSTEETSNENECRRRQWIYISMNGNAGLSKAYNKVLNFLDLEEDATIVWLDDDSNITQEYFDVLESNLNANKEYSIFVPVIQGQDGKYWSPNEYHFIKNRQLKSPEQRIKPTRFNAINSCTAVRTTVYRNYRYNENLFLDQIDHNFFEDQRNRMIKCKKMNVIIQHNFSTRSKQNIISLKRRYKTMIPDFLTFHRKSILRYYLAWIKIFGWGCRGFLSCRDISFIGWCVKQIYFYERKRKSNGL